MPSQQPPKSAILSIFFRGGIVVAEDVEERLKAVLNMAELEYPKGHVYVIRSLTKRKRRYDDPGANTSREPMVRHLELDAVVQRLAQFVAYLQSQLGIRMDFRASTSQALPPPPHRSITNRLGWIQLVHHSSNMMMKGTSKIG
ncbi:hypothetical protein Scep_030357 [Stephania cephalantha]|uniref:Uncharacterized protein n=1 Tax=Stephania cephalantha TaxID=152367 RepID=A0AAP0DZM0_9MAGN